MVEWQEDSDGGRLPQFGVIARNLSVARRTSPPNVLILDYCFRDVAVKFKIEEVDKSQP